MHEAIDTGAPTQQCATPEQRGIGDGGSKNTMMASKLKGGRHHAPSDRHQNAHAATRHEAERHRRRWQ